MSDLKEMIRQANETAVNKLKNAQPYWVDIKPAHEVLGIDKYTLLHGRPTHCVGGDVRPHARSHCCRTEI